MSVILIAISCVILVVLLFLGGVLNESGLRDLCHGEAWDVFWKSWLASRLLTGLHNYMVSEDGNGLLAFALLVITSGLIIANIVFAFQMAIERVDFWLGFPAAVAYFLTMWYWTWVNVGDSWRKIGQAILGR
jgi:hypothetical protein